MNKSLNCSNNDNLTSINTAHARRGKIITKQCCKTIVTVDNNNFITYLFILFRVHLTQSKRDN